MKKVLLTVFVIMIAATIAAMFIYKEKPTPHQWAGIFEGERLTSFMDEMGKLSVYKDDGASPDNSYDYCLRIYLKGSDGYISYNLGKEMVNVDMKSGAKEGFYAFKNYDEARDLVAKYFYAQ